MEILIVRFYRNTNKNVNKKNIGGMKIDQTHRNVGENSKI